MFSECIVFSNYFLGPRFTIQIFFSGQMQKKSKITNCALKKKVKHWIKCLSKVGLVWSILSLKSMISIKCAKYLMKGHLKISTLKISPNINFRKLGFFFPPPYVARNFDLLNNRSCGSCNAHKGHSKWCACIFQALSSIQACARVYTIH